jgi:cytochrome c-type biogenesis protein CcmH/NrfG
MKFYPLRRKDGTADPFAQGLVTHTVCSVYVFNVCKFEAWRVPSHRIGAYDTEAAAQTACVDDFRERYRTASRENPEKASA